MGAGPIIVPIDFSENSLEALKQAIFLARLRSCEIKMVYVGSSDNAKGKFDDLMNQHRDVTINYETAEGSVHKSIVTIAEKSKAQFIIIGTHGRSGFQELFMGSTAFRVVGTAPCPVISLRKATKGGKIKHIVLPLDTTPESRQKVDQVGKLADTYGSFVHLLGVSTYSDDQTKLKLELILELGSEKLKAVGVRHDMTIRPGGNITEKTLKFAKEKNADLIGIMTEQEPNIASILMGVFAQQMVNHSPIPVLSIRPYEMLNSGRYIVNA